jgi:hypothetical protein
VVESLRISYSLILFFKVAARTCGCKPGHRKVLKTEIDGFKNVLTTQYNLHGTNANDFFQKANLVREYSLCIVCTTDAEMANAL